MFLLPAVFLVKQVLLIQLMETLHRVVGKPEVTK
jgi:hypothetical protein